MQIIAVRASIQLSRCIPTLYKIGWAEEVGNWYVVMTNEIRWGNFIRQHFYMVTDRLDYDITQLFCLIREAKQVIASEPILIEIRPPVTIVGDLHGQFKDLRRILTATKSKRSDGVHINRYLFLGDYVDRGRNSLECIAMLLAYKLVFPNLYHLLRGNHEIASVNQSYGFYQELRDRFQEPEATGLWHAFNDLFSYFPLAALIRKRILCMHGGIGPTLKSLEDIRSVRLCSNLFERLRFYRLELQLRRPLVELFPVPLVSDLMWADPLLDLSGYVANTARGVSVYFGEDAVIKLCKKLKLDLIVRAHQVMPNGYGFFCRRKMVTIFSAARYIPTKKNRGAVMHVDKKLHIGFFIMNPATTISQGEERFRRTYTAAEKVPPYMSRQQVQDHFALLKTLSQTQLAWSSSLNRRIF